MGNRRFCPKKFYTVDDVECCPTLVLRLGQKLDILSTWVASAQTQCGQMWWNFATWANFLKVFGDLLMGYLVFGKILHLLGNLVANFRQLVAVLKYWTNNLVTLLKMKSSGIQILTFLPKKLKRTKISPEKWNPKMEQQCDQFGRNLAFWQNFGNYLAKLCGFIKFYFVQCNILNIPWQFFNIVNI